MTQRIAAKQIIHHLVEQGVTAFFVAPGSRSTPLVLAICEEKRAKSYVHFDERGLAFFALGYAKATKNPVAIVITSGTAIANLFPAVMEASLSFVPLILLTADRPQELRATGANQTVDQVKFFQDYVRWQGDLLLADSDLREQFWASLIGRIIAISKAPHPGPVHLNCAVRQPFDLSAEEVLYKNSPVVWEEARATIKKSNAEWHERMTQSRKGIILGGPGSYNPTPILALSKALQWPILADILSPLRRSQHSIHHFESILNASKDLQCDFVLHFGGRMVSEALYSWIKQQTLLAYCHVSPYPIWENPEHLVTHRLSMSPDDFATDYLAEHHLPERALETNWSEKDARAHSLLSKIFSEQQSWMEAAIAFSLQNIPAPIFLGNSMPIRHADRFLRPNHHVFANRGASGIDGNIATAAGIAEGLREPLVACIGDQTALHDLNSLTLLKTIPVPSLIVIDNCGGRIFSFLPIHQRRDVLEKFYTAPHTISFANLAKGFDIPHFLPQGQEELLSHLPPNSTTTSLITIHTKGSNIVEEHRYIQQRIQEQIADKQFPPLGLTITHK